MGCASSRNKDRELEFLVLGLENAGKSRFINALNENAAQDFYPLVTVNVQKINYEGNKIRLWEIRGNAEGRGIWSEYYANKNGIIYVIDGNDTSKTIENVKTLRNLIEDPALKGVPLIVLINKKDKGIEIRLDGRDGLREMLKFTMEKSPRYYSVHEISSETKERVVAGIQDLLAFHQPSCILTDKRKKYGYLDYDNSEKTDKNSTGRASNKDEREAKNANEKPGNRV